MVADRTVKTKYKSSCQEVFFKKGVYRNLAKFIGKHLCQSLFLKVFEKKTAFPIEHPRWLLLIIKKIHDNLGRKLIKRALFLESRKFYTRKNNSKANFVNTGHIVTEDSSKVFCKSKYVIKNS